MNYKTELIIIFFFIISAGILLTFFMNLDLTGKSIVEDEIINGPPSPRIIELNCEKRTIDNVRQIELIAFVKNYGRGGNVTINAGIYEEGTEFKDIKSRDIHMNSGQTKEEIFYFNLGDSINAKCFAKAFVSEK